MVFAISELSKVRRLAKRASYDKEVVNSILDAALVAHVAFVDQEGRPRQTPVIFGRCEDVLYIHGHVSAGLFRNGSLPICFNVTLEDGLVLARSGMHSSINYRSVTVHGEATEVTGELKWKALDAIVEHMCAGRTGQLRPMAEAEVATTRVLQLKMEDGKVSAKVRAEGAHDDQADIEQCPGIWAGVLPMTRVFGPPVNNEDCSIAPPENISKYPKNRCGVPPTILGGKRPPFSPPWALIGAWAVVAVAAVVATRLSTKGSLR